MKRMSLLSLFALLVVVFLSSCQDQRTPTAPEATIEPSMAVLDQNDDVLDLIDEIYPERGLNRSAKAHWRNIQRQWLRGKEAVARGQLFAFVDQALILFEAGKLLVDSPDPELNDLFDLMFEAVEIEAPVFTEDFLDSEDTGWGPVTPAGGADIPTENGWARVHVDPGTASESSFLTIELLPEEQCTAAAGYMTALGCWDIDQYGGEPFEHIVEICVADPGGWTDSEYYVEQRLHALEEEAGAIPAPLPLVNSTLDCSDFPRGEYVPPGGAPSQQEDQSVLGAIGSAVAEFLLPDPLAALFRADRRPPRGIGGVAGSFTWYFGALPLEEEEEYESFPTDPPASTADTWEITEPAAPVALCNLAGGVGCPMGSVESVAISAEARTDPGTIDSPWYNVYFYYKPAGLPGPITSIGSTGVPVIIDDGIDRYWTWTVTLIGEDIPDPGAIDVFAVGQFDPLDGGDLYATGLATTITVVDVLYDDFTPGTGDADAWDMSAPSAFVALCNEPGGAGCPAGTDVSVDVSARAMTGTGVLDPPWSNVHFFRKPKGSAGPITPIGSTDSATLTDNGFNRFWTSTVTLVGEDIPDLGEIDIFAVGEDGVGDMYSTDPTSTVTVVDQGATLPDLVVSSIDLGILPVLDPGDEVSFDYQMDNLGAAALEFQLGGLPSQFDVATYLSTDAILDGADIRLFDGYTGFSFPIPAGWGLEGAMLDVGLPETLAPGVYYLIVKVDAFPGVFYPGVVETNEENNWLASEPITIQAGTVSGTVSVEGTGISGVSVTLVGALSWSATTGAGGGYTFSNVPLGGYTVSVSDLPLDATFLSTSAGVTLSSSGEVVTADFTGTFIRTASIGGTVLGGGSPLGGVDIAITGGPDAVTYALNTNGAGEYLASGFRAGTYDVTITPPTGYAYPSSTRTETVATGQALSGVDFFGIDPGPFDNWKVIGPATGVTLCDGSPGVCSGVGAVTVVAEASFPSSTILDPWDWVEFEYSVPGSGVWTEIGTTTANTYSDQGFYSFYTYQMVLVGTGLPVGPIEIRVLGVIDSGGPVYYETVSNTQVTVVAGSVDP